MEAQKPAEDHCFRRLAGMDLVFEPRGGQREGKKHPCPDCSFCQFCAETRCLACRSERNRGKATACKKLSFHEQILLYEKVNAKAHRSRVGSGMFRDGSGISNKRSCQRMKSKRISWFVVGVAFLSGLLIVGPIEWRSRMAAVQEVNDPPQDVSPLLPPSPKL